LPFSTMDQKNWGSRAISILENGKWAA